MISFINLSDVIGGQEFFLLNLLKEFEGQHNIQIFTKVSTWDSNILDELKNTKIVDLKSIEYKDFLKLKQIIEKHIDDEDVCIFNGNRAIYLGSLLSNKYKKIAIQHSSIDDVQQGNWKRLLRKSFYNCLLYRYNELVGVSKNTIKPIANSKKVSVIYNGVDTDRFYPITIDKKQQLKSELGINLNDKIILMVGTLTDNKGQFEALRIIEKLDNNYKLVIVGQGPDKNKIEQYVSQRNLTNRVLLAGVSNDVRKFYWISDVLLFLSNNEGLPLVILEAMASGLPILTTMVGGIPEIIVENENGIFIERNDTDDTVLKIQQLLRNDNLITKMKKSNINKVSKELSLTKNINQFLEKINKYSK